MITINLLPTQRKKAGAHAPNQAFLLLFAAVIGVGALAIAWFYHNEVAVRRAQLHEITSQKTAYEKDVQIAKDYQAKLDALKARKDLIDELFHSGPEIARKLNQISDLIPNKIWLEAIDLATEKKQEQKTVKKGETTTTQTVQVEYTTLTLTGVSEDLANGPTLMADFISRLQNSPFMEDISGEIKPLYQGEEPWLENANAPGAKRPVWRFRIAMQINKEARKAKDPKSGAPRTVAGVAEKVANR